MITVIYEFIYFMRDSRQITRKKLKTNNTIKTVTMIKLNQKTSMVIKITILPLQKHPLKQVHFAHSVE